MSHLFHHFLVTRRNNVLGEPVGTPRLVLVRCSEPVQVSADGCEMILKRQFTDYQDAHERYMCLQEVKTYSDVLGDALDGSDAFAATLLNNNVAERKMGVVLN